MFSRIHAVLIEGVTPLHVQVETDIGDGLPGISMVGSLSSSVREAQERVRTAIHNEGISVPAKRITVNLSPAGIRKVGSGFDLPLAVSVLAALEIFRFDAWEDTLFVGELGLDGSVRPVDGILPAAIWAAGQGFRRFIIPEGNRREALAAGGIACYPVRSLHEVLGMLMGSVCIAPVSTDDASIWEAQNQYELDFSDIRGQQGAVRAAQAAVAGMHNFMMVGPPGGGKTMIASRLPTIFPGLTREECIEISSVYSAAGKLDENKSLILERPFRVPHHSLTAAGLCGGGLIPRPGEVSFAHLGVLFLDELPEYSQHVLEMLRQPMEEGVIRITRQHGSYLFPCRFMLAAAMNPCPCGFYPDRNRCTCNQGQILRYLNHISGPLMDRIDICVEVSAGSYYDLKEYPKGEESERIRERIEAAVRIQRERFAGTGISFNSQMPAAAIDEYCPLGPEEDAYMRTAYESLHLSVRSYHKILKVARTLADLEGTPDIGKEHLAEAVHYRILDKKYWGR